MKKSSKKNPIKSPWKLLFWFVIAAGVLWLVFAPGRRDYGPRNAPVHVAVEHAPEPKPLPPSAPVAPPPETMQAKPPQGDERSQAQSTVPVTQEPAQPVEPYQHKPMIAIVIDDMGLDLRDSRRAEALPAYVTLSYMPYAVRLREQTKEARDHGHELLLHMPMEPVGRDDPGPGALLASLPPDEIRRRFEAALGSFIGFDGVNNHMGSKFTAYREGMQIVADELKQRDLFFLDSRTSANTVGASIARAKGVPAASRDVFLDDVIDSAAVHGQLAETERIARRKGYAIAIGHPHAATLQAIEAWLPEAEMGGVELVPLNRLVR